jgi:hypothetical protein
MNRVPPIKITKNYILDNIPQEDIFATYWNISSGDIIDCANSNSLIISPIRPDNNASMGFRFSNGKLRAKDFGGYFWGDCFDAAAYSLNLNSKDSVDFNILLDDIAARFNLKSQSTRKIKLKQILVDMENRPPPVFSFVRRDWNEYDKDYWHRRYGLSQKDLEYWNVYAAEAIFINGNRIYTYNPFDPSYIYYLGRKNNIDVIRVYSPLREKWRWAINVSSLQGVHQLRKAKYGLLIKSYKDAMVANMLATKAELDINFLATANEVVLPNSSFIQYLRTIWQYIYGFVDYDKAGIIYAKKLNSEFGIRSFFLTNGNNFTYDFGAKDISDYVEINGVKKGVELIKFVHNIISKLYGKRDYS